MFLRVLYQHNVTEFVHICWLPIYIANLSSPSKHALLNQDPVTVEATGVQWPDQLKKKYITERYHLLINR